MTAGNSTGVLLSKSRQECIKDYSIYLVERTHDEFSFKNRGHRAQSEHFPQWFAEIVMRPFPRRGDDKIIFDKIRAIACLERAIERQRVVWTRIRFQTAWNWCLESCCDGLSTIIMGQKSEGASCEWVAGAIIGNNKAITVISDCMEMTEFLTANSYDYFTKERGRTDWKPFSLWSTDMSCRNDSLRLLA